VGGGGGLKKDVQNRGQGTGGSGVRMHACGQSSACSRLRYRGLLSVGWHSEGEEGGVGVGWRRSGAGMCFGLEGKQSWGTTRSLLFT
jgi:hypothetical protein